MVEIDKLKKSPSLDAIIRKAATKMGDNHAHTRDTDGVVLSNEGDTHKYTQSQGRHPSRLNQTAIKGTEAYRVLGEQDNAVEEEKTVAELEKELKEEIQKIKTGVNGHPPGAVTMKIKMVTAKYKKLIDAAKRRKQESNEATGASSAGSYSAPLFGDWKEDDEEAEKIVEGTIKEKVEKVLLEETLDKMVDDELEEELDETGSYGTGIGLNYSEKDPAYDFASQGPFPGKDIGGGYNFESQGPLNEELKQELKHRIVKNLSEQFTEKPKKARASRKGTPGIDITKKTLNLDKIENDDYYNLVDKKIKDYLDIDNNSHPEFPHQNNSKTDYKSPMYRNTTDEEDFIDDFRGMGLEDANGVEELDRLSAYLGGSQETGNAQKDKEGKALGNVVPTDLGKRLQKKIKRKKDVIAYRKSKMSNLKGYTPDVQTVSESVENDINKIKHLYKYTDTTQ